MPYRSAGKWTREFAGWSLPCALIMTLIFGCVYQGPETTSVDLMERLSDCRSSLPDFSFDLNTPLMIPFLTGFGMDPFKSNIVSEGEDVEITIPFSPVRPEFLALEIQPVQSPRDSGYVRILLNEEDLGFIAVSGVPIRKQFRVRDNLWNTEINRITAHLPRGAYEARVNNLWLLTAESKDLQALQTGNIYTGLAVYPLRNDWQKGIFLASGSSLTFPVRLPRAGAHLCFSVYADGKTDLDLAIEATAAGKFGRKDRFRTEVSFREADRWIPVKWDISELSGRHVALQIENRGIAPILLQDPGISI